MPVKKVNICIAIIFYLTVVLYAETGWSLDKHGGSMGKNNDHSSHIVPPGKKKTRSVVKYNMPEVVLLTQDGDKVNFNSFLKRDKTVLVDFIFSTCSTICPLLSAGFAHFQDQLDHQRENVQLLSILSIRSMTRQQYLMNTVRGTARKRGGHF